jgi:hypothetical protein
MNRSWLRFSIRDVLWLTLVVALAVGWLVHQYQLRVELQKAHAWRQRAGALEFILTDAGWKVEWDFASSQVNATWHKDKGLESAGANVSTTHFDPSSDPP